MVTLLSRQLNEHLRECSEKHSSHTRALDKLNALVLKVAGMMIIGLLAVLYNILVSKGVF